MLKRLTITAITLCCFSTPVLAEDDWGEGGYFECDEACQYEIMQIASSHEYTDDYWKNIDYDWSVATLADGSYVTNPAHATDAGGFYGPTEPFASSSNKTIKIGNYSANLVAGSDQWIVDAANQAAIFSWNGKNIIADHAKQGFSAISSNNLATICGMNYEKVSQYYGVNEGDIYLNDGRIFYDVPDGQLIMYTCVGGGDNVVITYWTPTDKTPETLSDVTHSEKANVSLKNNKILEKRLKRYTEKIIKLYKNF